MVLAATVICGACLFSSCKKDEENTPGEGIAMIVKNGQIDYWRQIETAFRSACSEKGLEAYYYATTAENAYQEQIAAVEELRNSGKNLKGIIFVPSFGVGGESAEAAVAALAAERGIPVVILDSPVGDASPLAACPYFGTDNAAAGRAMAAHVAADRIAAFAMANSPGVERAQAFKALKPNTDIFTVGDVAVSEVQAVMNEYNDFVFFNGNDCIGVLAMLKAAGKNVYTFDVYSEFLDELIAGNSFLKGVMAQNTFAMTRKAVDAVVARATSGEMVPTFYITSANLDNPNVQPFLEFYGRTNSSTGEVRLTQQYMVAVRATGDTVTTVTQDFVWENGLLRRSYIHNFVAYTGSTINDETIYDYDNDGNCIAEHYTATNLNYDRYYTYEGGRMTSAVEVRGSDTIGRATITGYTADGHIQALTVESLTSGRVTDYQLTWQNGDMTGYTKYPVTPAGEDESYTIEYDNYPNIRTGMPLAGSVFDPEMIASKASVHNWQILDQEYFYNNGRLIRATSSTSALSTVTYYTYSDGTTGRE